jgi:hypothetical protein
MEMKIAAELIMVSRDTSEFYRDIPSGIFPQKQKNKGRIGKKDFRFWNSGFRRSRGVARAFDFLVKMRRK